MRPFRIARAKNDLVYDEEGRAYIDLFTSHGTTWLGHCHPLINAAVQQQLDDVWITGAIDTPVLARAKGAIESFFPSSYRVAALCSTGMEAAELALRVARVATGKLDVIGFERSMHGKSMATAYLGWDNNDDLLLPFIHRLPFLQTASEEQILKQLRETLEKRRVSAVFVEPFQGSGGGYMASSDYYR